VTPQASGRRIRPICRILRSKKRRMRLATTARRRLSPGKLLPKGPSHDRMTHDRFCSSFFFCCFFYQLYLLECCRRLLTGHKCLGDGDKSSRGKLGGKGRKWGGKGFQNVHVFMALRVFRRPTERQKGNDIIFPCIIVAVVLVLHTGRKCLFMAEVFFFSFLFSLTICRLII